jgi:flagellin
MTRINTNVSSLVAQTNLAKSNTDLQTALTRLSTGLRINTGKDDPAGLIASEDLGSDIVSVQNAISNSQQADQLIATADSALGQVSSLLNDIRGLVSEAANTGALSSDQIAANQLQLDSSLDAIDRISQTTTFQGRRLLDGSLGFITTSAGNVPTNASGSFGTVDAANASGSIGGALTLSATAAGSSFNGDVVIAVASSGATTVSYSSGTLTITATAGATAADLASAINAEGTYSATATSATATFSAATFTGALAGGADSNHITLSAASGGSAFNNINVTINIASNGATDATYSAGTLTITASAGATTNDLITAINTQGTFSASTAGGGAGVYTSGTTSAVTSGGDTTSKISDLEVDQANFGTASSIGVQVDIDQQATKAELTYSGGTLASDLVLQVGGQDGFQSFNFGSGTTVNQIATALNQVSDATGVKATVSGTGLELQSTEYGSDAFVSAKAIAGSFDTKNTGGSDSTRETGTDIVARVNGVQATGQGLQASINTATLQLSFSANSQLTDGSSFNFSITGGGANFQLGPDVVSNQQARLGIQDVSTATLGGVSGSLFELRSGGSKDLTTDVDGAAKIVDEVINQVTSLRGRLGAFQKTTLETNINSLNDTLENLTTAQSSIRDADFAAESANLTRAQILVQSGTAVLQIANQNPQNVLQLLKGA